MQENPHFCAKELGCGVLVSVVGRDVDETIYIVFGDGFGYTLGTFDVNVFKIEVSVFLPVSAILFPLVPVRLTL